MDEELRTLRTAYRRRVRAFNEARWRMADRIGEIEHPHREYRERAEARIADLEAQNADLRREVDWRQSQLDSVLNTKTFRYTAGLRAAYGRIRGLFRR